MKDMKLRDMKDTLEEMERDWKRKHPIKNWIDSLFPSGGLFGYAPHYSLTHPHVIFMDLMREIKWAYQRVVRGWDDRASWSVDYWLNSIMPEILTTLKKNKHGIPMNFFYDLEPDEHGHYSDEQDKIASDRWEIELDKMISAFSTLKKIDDCLYTWEEEKQLEKTIIKEGMESFIKYYRNLWY